MDVLNGQLEDHGVSINAGLTTAAVYLPILFQVRLLGDDRWLNRENAK